MRECDHPTRIVTPSESAAAHEPRGLFYRLKDLSCYEADLLLEKILFNAPQNPPRFFCSAGAELLVAPVAAAELPSPNACCNASANSGTATRPENSHSGTTRASRMSRTISGVGYSGGAGAAFENVNGATTV